MRRRRWLDVMKSAMRHNKQRDGRREGKGGGELPTPEAEHARGEQRQLGEASANGGGGKMRQCKAVGGGAAAVAGCYANMLCAKK